MIKTLLRFSCVSALVLGCSSGTVWADEIGKGPCLPGLSQLLKGENEAVYDERFGILGSSAVALETQLDAVADQASYEALLDLADGTATTIGDLTAVNASLFLVIERDNFEGASAQFKKIFLVDLNHVDAQGFLVKRQVADLLQITDPDGLAGGCTFRFPFQTIESVIVLSAVRIGVLDDNNYPFSNGRVPGQPDPDEFIILRLDRPLTRP